MRLVSITPTSIQFSAPLRTTNARLDKSPCSLRRSPFFFRRVFDLLSRLEALIVFFGATILRHFTIPRHCPRLRRASRELRIVVRKYSRLLSLFPAHGFRRIQTRALRVHGC